VDREDAPSRPPVRIERAGLADLPEALRVQHCAFARVARWLGMEDASQLPPMAETLEDVERLVEDQGAIVLIARTGEGMAGPVVGTVRGLLGEDGSVEIGRLGVADSWEGRGIGRALMIAIEEAYPDVERFVLFTGRDATGPIRLYESLGYGIVSDQEFSPGVFVVWLEKCRKRRVDSSA